MFKYYYSFTRFWLKNVTSSVNGFQVRWFTIRIVIILYSLFILTLSPDPDLEL